MLQSGEQEDSVKRKTNCIGVIERRTNPVRYYLYGLLFWKYHRTSVNFGPALTYLAYDAGWEPGGIYRQDTPA